jgi:hypothetical protein
MQTCMRYGRDGCTVPLVGGLRHGCRAHLIQLLPFRDQVLAFAHDGRQAGIAFGPRAAIFVGGDAGRR